MNNSRNIKLLIAYDGTDFSGWQRQENPSSQGPLRTVQAVIEDALHKIHKEPVALTGSGRTDSGVHAVGQAANFYTDIHSIPAERFVPAINSFLPHDVRVLSAEEVDFKFHSRFDAVMRTYRYYFIPVRQMLPHEYRYNLHLYRYPDIEILNAYGRLLLGETDCTVFAAAGDTSKSRFRYITGAHFFIENNKLVFEISANAFLWKMVRSVAGTFLHYEEKGTSPKELREIIASKGRSLAGPTLPPQGLFLWKIDFN